MLLQFERNDQFGAVPVCACRKKPYIGGPTFPHREMTATENCRICIDAHHCRCPTFRKPQAHMRCTAGPVQSAGRCINWNCAISKHCELQAPAPLGTRRGSRHSLRIRPDITRWFASVIVHPLHSMRRTGSTGLLACPALIFPPHGHAVPYGRTHQLPNRSNEVSCSPRTTIVTDMLHLSAQSVIPGGP
jgi:hypothetical protein